VDIASLCRAHGVAHRQVADLETLRAALAAPAAGIEVVEVPTSRDDLRALARALRDAVSGALG
jgi:2-succinyl-5-enolpyruvyl-6-hydroxy-3-cyclohexene-1-carboxylate synthase